MATPPVCRYCGTALPRAALFCPNCARPTFVLTGRRQRRRRDASVVGMAGALVMAAQGASMLAGGVVAMFALRLATGGDLSGAIDLAGTAAIFVGITLLFDLLGIFLLGLAFYLHTKAIGPADSAAAEGRRQLVRFGLLATAFLVLWVLVTVAWRLALAAIVSFYPTPFGGALDAVSAEDLRRAASIMLGLWVAAAFLLFLGATFGARFLQRMRGVPLTFGRLLWPLEAVVHFSAAVGIALIAPTLLASPTAIDLTALRIIETLAVIDLVIVPALGVLAYLYLFRDFRGLYRASLETEATPGSPEGAVPDTPGEA